jgi:hypothetical protein
VQGPVTHLSGVAAGNQLRIATAKPIVARTSSTASAVKCKVYPLMENVSSIESIRYKLRSLLNNGKRQNESARTL